MRGQTAICQPVVCRRLVPRTNLLLPLTKAEVEVTKDLPWDERASLKPCPRILGGPLDGRTEVFFRGTEGPAGDHTDVRECFQELDRLGKPAWREQRVAIGECDDFPGSGPKNDVPRAALSQVLAGKQEILDATQALLLHQIFGRFMTATIVEDHQIVGQVRVDPDALQTCFEHFERA